MQHFMKKQIEDILLKSVLFKGLSADKTAPVFKLLCPRIKIFARGDFVWLQGQPVHCFGIVLAGGLQIVQESETGQRALLAQFGPADLFGEALACARVEASPVGVLAIQETTVWLIEAASVWQAGVPWLSQRLVELMARKNVYLTRRLDHLSQRSIRGKVLSYLIELQHLNKSNGVLLPLTRTALAEFLFVDRSALSREIGNMQKEGLLQILPEGRIKLLCTL